MSLHTSASDPRLPLAHSCLGILHSRLASPTWWLAFSLPHPPFSSPSASFPLWPFALCVLRVFRTRRQHSRSSDRFLNTRAHNLSFAPHHPTFFSFRPAASLPSLALLFQLNSALTVRIRLSQSRSLDHVPQPRILPCELAILTLQLHSVCASPSSAHHMPSPPLVSASAGVFASTFALEFIRNSLLSFLPLMCPVLWCLWPGFRTLRSLLCLVSCSLLRSPWSSRILTFLLSTPTPLSYSNMMFLLRMFFPATRLIR